MTFAEIAVGPLVGQLLEERMELSGFLIIQLTTPLGCNAPAIPVMVVVRVTRVLRVGLGEATKVMTGALASKVRVNGEALVAVR